MLWWWGNGIGRAGDVLPWLLSAGVLGCCAFEGVVERFHHRDREF